MNPRDFRKAAPYLGALLLSAIVFTVVRSLLYPHFLLETLQRSDS
jgi:hypothetical protein